MGVHILRCIVEIEKRLQNIGCHDPTKPSRIEVDVYGWGTFYVRFLKNASKAIREKQDEVVS
jgi:hypothetical protein